MTMLHELSKIDRRAALIYNREILLLKKEEGWNLTMFRIYQKYQGTCTILLTHSAGRRHAKDMTFGRRF